MRQRGEPGDAEAVPAPATRYGRAGGARSQEVGVPHARPAGSAATRETGITRLVAAEREWREALDRADAAAARLVDEARAAEAAADAALEREIERLLAARAVETQTALHERCTALCRQADERAARYDGAGVALETRLASEIADRLWGAEAAAQAVAGEEA